MSANHTLRHSVADSRAIVLCPAWTVEENGCHVWTGSRSTRGYGMVRANGRMSAVHRVRYEREVGPIPPGLVLDHFVCNNRACCNPLHVRPVSNRENILRGDGPSAINAARNHCANGHPLLRRRDGKRHCPTCQKAGARRRYAERAK